MALFSGVCVCVVMESGLASQWLRQMAKMAETHVAHGVLSDVVVCLRPIRDPCRNICIGCGAWSTWAHAVSQRDPDTVWLWDAICWDAVAARTSGRANMIFGVCFEASLSMRVRRGNSRHCMGSRGARSVLSISVSPWWTRHDFSVCVQQCSVRSGQLLNADVRICASACVRRAWNLGNLTSILPSTGSEERAETGKRKREAAACAGCEARVWMWVEWWAERQWRHWGGSVPSRKFVFVVVRMRMWWL